MLIKFVIQDGSLVQKKQQNIQYKQEMVTNIRNK